MTLDKCNLKCFYESECREFAYTPKHRDSFSKENGVANMQEPSCDMFKNPCKRFDNHRYANVYFPQKITKPKLGACNLYQTGVPTTTLKGSNFYALPTTK